MTGTPGPFGPVRTKPVMFRGTARNTGRLVVPVRTFTVWFTGANEKPLVEGVMV